MITKNEKVLSDDLEEEEQIPVQDSSKQNSKSESRESETRWSLAIISIRERIPGTHEDSFVVPTSFTCDFNKVSDYEYLTTFIYLHLANLIDSGFFKDEEFITSIVISAFLDSVSGYPLEFRSGEFRHFKDVVEWKNFKDICLSLKKFSQSHSLEEDFSQIKHLEEVKNGKEQRSRDD